MRGPFSTRARVRWGVVSTGRRVFLLKKVCNNVFSLSRDDKTDLADAILTVAATTFSEPPADTCPTPEKTVPGSPTNQPGSASASKRASPVIAFGHRVTSPGSGKKSPGTRREQTGGVSVTLDETLADVATAVLKPWLGELFVLAVGDRSGAGVPAQSGEVGGTGAGNGTAERNGTSERSGTERPGDWFGDLLQGWGVEQAGGKQVEPGAGDDGARRSKTNESAVTTEGAESVRGKNQDAQVRGLSVIKTLSQEVGQFSIRRKVERK